MLALGSMGLHPPAYNQIGYNLRFGSGHAMSSLLSQQLQPIQMGMAFPGTSPGFHAMGHANSFFGYAPTFGMPHHSTVANSNNTPDAKPNNEDGSDGHGGADDAQPKPISGLSPPIVFAHTGMPANNQMVARAPGGMGMGHDGNYHPAVLQVVSTDSQHENGGANPTHMTMVPFGNVVALQKPKKWVRWSDHEDQTLRSYVEQYGENNFRLISEQVFHGSRTEVQCKNRWKKALQPGLVKGRWSQEEDDIITNAVDSGNTKWSDIAKHLPGRIGEQIKERWVNVLDPDVKKGVWTEAEMKILRDAQRELGNKWSDIARRIPGRSENSVKNRWYNQKTSDKRAQKKKNDQASFKQSIPQQNTMSHHNAVDHDGPMMHIPPHLEEQAQQLYEHESEEYRTDELNVFDGREDV